MASNKRRQIWAASVDDVDAVVDVRGIAIGQRLDNRNDVLLFHLMIEEGVDNGVEGKIEKKWDSFLTRQRAADGVANVSGKFLH